MPTRPFYDAATNLYWILKGRTDQGVPERLEIGQTFTLEKAALFNYPVNQILLVCKDEFDALAYAKVLSFEQNNNVTRVHCKIIRTLESQEKLALTHYLQTTQQLLKESV
jgi:hypothetical protein